MMYRSGCYPSVISENNALGGIMKKSLVLVTGFAALALPAVLTNPIFAAMIHARRR
jgi:hypothetical protein